MKATFKKESSPLVPFMDIRMGDLFTEPGQFRVYMRTEAVMDESNTICEAVVLAHPEPSAGLKAGHAMDFDPQYMVIPLEAKDLVLKQK